MAHPKKSVITAKDWLYLSLFFLLVVLEMVYVLNQFALGAMSL
jgi:hypothetical protein